MGAWFAFLPLRLRSVGIVVLLLLVLLRDFISEIYSIVKFNNNRRLCNY